MSSSLTVDNRNAEEMMAYLQDRVTALRAELAKERREHALALAQIAQLESARDIYIEAMLEGR